MSAFSSRVASLAAELAGVQLEISATNVSILKVEGEIDTLAVQITAVEAELGSFQEKESPAYLLERENYLRDEKKQLREKEKQLREKKKQLRDEKKDLRDEKARYEAFVLGTTAREEDTSVADEIGKLTIGTTALVITTSNQSNASTFATNAFAAGFGSLPSSFMLDPTSDLRVWTNLVPESKTLVGNVKSTMVGNVKSLPVLGEQGDLLYQGANATVPACVRKVLDKYLSFNHLQTWTSSVRSLDLLYGIVNEGSIPDFMWVKDGIARGVLEVKGGDGTVLSALRQAAVTGTSIAENLLRRGMHSSDIVIPVAGTNGRAMQFGAIIVLSQSFATFLPTSPLLDLANDASNALACLYLDKASKFVDSQPSLPSSLGKKKTLLALDCSAYHIKKLSREVLMRGLGLFAVSESPTTGEVGLGLAHMGRALNRLFQHGAARAVTAFPLSVRAPDVDPIRGDGVPADNATCEYWIIYEDLGKQGFRIGTPNRIEEEMLYHSYVSALRQAITAVHDAGVIHCDLYVSNVMWRRGLGNTVEIRLIDWDCAHCLDELGFNEHIEKALRANDRDGSANFGVEHDLFYISVLEMEVDRRDEGLWTELAREDKAAVDRAFFALYNVKKVRQ